MANDHTIKIYSTEDIRKYHSGSLSPREMNAMEKAALDDPFLADALDGYSYAGKNLNADLTDLQTRLQQRLQEQKVIPLYPAENKKFNWWKVAAMLILVAGAGLLTFQFISRKKTNALAQETTLQRPDSSNAATTSNATVNPKLSDSANPAAVDDLSKTIHNGPAKLDQVATAKSEPDLAKTKTIAKGVQVAPGIVKPDDQLEVKIEQKKAAADAVQDNSALESVVIAPAIDKSKENSAANRARVEQFYKNNKIFKGRITDQQNNAVPFANITNPIDNVGTYSDANGFFSLTSPDSILRVQVRSLGFENNNVALNNTSTENRIQMLEDRALSARILDTVKRNANRVRNNTMKLEEPEPADGWSNYDTYIVNNIVIPEIFKSRQVSSGEVELSFEVNKLGEPVNIKVVKSLCETCDKEAIRLVKEGPKWKGKTRKNRTTVTVSF